MNPINAETCQAVVDCVIEKMNARYIFAETGARFETDIRAKVAAGAYQQAQNWHELARHLTDDLQQSTKDRHLRVEYIPEFYDYLVEQAKNPEPPGTDDHEAEYIQHGMQNNFGFERVERLKGNIGYIRLNGFFNAKYGGETAIAAMGFVANTWALIFDLRWNGGGWPSMVQLLSSYLFDEPKHLNSFYTRHSDAYEQFWTQSYVPGKRLSKIPVYVLTSSITFSAAEEFTYNLKHLKRATIIGETTGGGAHPLSPHPLLHGLVMGLCQARAVNPITKTNWEGTGVEPDIKLPADDALAKAHVLALETLRDKTETPKEKTGLEWDIETARAMYEPLQIPVETLNQSAGKYGEYRFFVRDRELEFAHHDFEFKLLPMAESRFAAANDEGVRFQFVAAEAGMTLHVLRRNEPDAVVIPRSPD